MAGVPSTIEDKERFTMLNSDLNSHTETPSGTSVRHRHNDGTTTTAETTTPSSTIPQPVPTEADNVVLPQPPQRPQSPAVDNVPDETMDCVSSDTSSIAEEAIDGFEQYNDLEDTAICTMFTNGPTGSTRWRLHLRGDSQRKKQRIDNESQCKAGTKGQFHTHKS
eukprot:6146264-Amphidinium_carterae.1